MRYEAELEFLRSVLKKCHVRSVLVSPSLPLDDDFDLGLRRQLGLSVNDEALFDEALKRAMPNTIYKLTDRFLCSYLFFLLQGAEEQTVFAMGPYLSAETTREELLEQAERSGVPPAMFHNMEIFYTGVPVVLGDNPLFAALDTFCEKMWGGAAEYALVDINRELYEADMPLVQERGEVVFEEVLTNMQLIETRYAYENEMMNAVSRGLFHKAETMIFGFSHMSFEQRLADPVRNLKNYCVIMNTLLRKAAESGGVHPVYLDRISSDYAKKIEAISATKMFPGLMTEMFRTYCNLVRKHSMKDYSPPVQRAILCIESDLSADLGLKALADMQNINASYLSAMFKKETGQTITDYVNKKRVKKATHLLGTTKLQVQTIAQHCGIPDVNYFSKIFKKYTDRTPKEYRREVGKGEAVKK